jgi:hypothetical protein
MSFFGRQSQTDLDRGERFRAWVGARTPFALLSFLFGIVAVLDAFTLILGVAAGVAALALGGLGLRDLKRRGHLSGHRFCAAGMILGLCGILLSMVMWTVVYPALGRG